jgi:hypothetical protein
MWITFKSQPGLYFALMFSPVEKNFPPNYGREIQHLSTQVHALTTIRHGFAAALIDTHIQHVVVRNTVDEFVVRVDSSLGRNSLL